MGKLYAQLDEWEKKIAELDSPLLAANELPNAEESAPTKFLPSDATYPDESEAFVDLRALFRELARRVHPDFASGPADAAQRNRLMAQANDAFRRKDTDMLQRMLNGHDAHDLHATTADKLARISAQIHSVKRDIGRVEAETDALAQSELAKLRQRTFAAAKQGRDLLAEMAARVKGNIGMAMRRYDLDLERRRRKQAPLDPTSFLSAEAPAASRGTTGRR